MQTYTDTYIIHAHSYSRVDIDNKLVSADEKEQVEVHATWINIKNYMKQTQPIQSRVGKTI